MKKLSYLLTALLAIFGFNNSQNILPTYVNITEDTPVVLKHSLEIQQAGFVLNDNITQDNMTRLYHYSHSSHRSHYSHSSHSSHRSHYSGY